MIDDLDSAGTPSDTTPSSSTVTLNSENNNNDETISIDEAIDRIGNGKFQQQLMFATGTAFMADSVEIMLLSFLTLVLSYEWDWRGDNDSPIEIPIITSSVFAGALIGTLFLGNLGDRLGRRPVLFIAAFIICFFGVLSALCNSFISLLIVRLLVGFGIGGKNECYNVLDIA